MNKKRTILLVEDNKEFANKLSDYLKEEGLDVICAYDGLDGLKKLQQNSIDLILLDIILPQLNGLEFLERIQGNNDVLVVVMSAVRQDKVVQRAIKLGASKYIDKQESYELPKYINSFLNESDKIRKISKGIWKIDDIVINFPNMTIIKDGDYIKIGKKSMEILRVFLYNKDNVLSREQLIESVWGEEGQVISDRTVDSYISKIKKTLDIDWIESVPGVGYRLAC